MQASRWKVALLAGCCAMSATALAGGPVRHARLSRRLPTMVDSVRVSGHVHVMLQASKKHRGRLSVASTGSGASHAVVTIKGNELSIDAGPAADQTRPLQVMLSLSRPIHQLVLAGNVHLDGRRVPTSHLRVALSGASVLDLRGMIDLTSIRQTGVSIARLDWVNSHHVTLKDTGLATTYLAGVTGSLDATQSGHSTMYAQYLQAKTVFVATQGHAMAYVKPQLNLRAFARGRSNVYYMTTPLHKTLQTKGDANVLFMSSQDPWDSMVGLYQKGAQHNGH